MSAVGHVDGSHKTEMEGEGFGFWFLVIEKKRDLMGDGNDDGRRTSRPVHDSSDQGSVLVLEEGER